MIKDNQILTKSAQFLKGVGPKKIKVLNKLNIFTVEDLLFYFPRRYEDRSNLKPISKVTIGEVETVRGRVLTMGLRRLKGRKTIFQLAIGDDSGVIYGTWFNQPYMKNVFRMDEEVILHGKVDRYRTLQINSPEYEILKTDEEDETIHTGRIVPIYPLTLDISQRYLRTLLKRCVDNYAEHVEEFMSDELIREHNLLPLKESIENIHFPANLQLQQEARRRLAFDEFFLLQFALAIKKYHIKNDLKGISYKLRGKMLDEFRRLLPFELTVSQKQVIDEIEQDMQSASCMNRLLQGDVGSGKTIVSVWAMVICVQNGYQAALMAPTEILTQQHKQNIEKLVAPLNIKVVSLSSGMPPKEKQKAVQMIKEKKADIIIGTHSLIQDEVKWDRLGLIIVDEQHKFGVMQRIKLQKKAQAPDVLVMSATPIPRTLAVTLYGDLDISTIRELPPGRTPVETYWISEKKRLDFYAFLKKKIREKNQVYVVYPVVEKSKLTDLKAATKMFEHFRDHTFKEFQVGLIHGRMNDAKKKEVMQLFIQGKLDILVATTVIEVGIDVPNASVILIEHAERFGLSQLHQLRGRVGRGRKQAYCVLLSDAKSDDAVKRLTSMTKTSDGFKIAEYDLLIRGPGEFFGVKQHGLPELKIGDIVNDRELLILARKAAFSFLKRNPSVIAQDNNPVIRQLKRRFPGFAETSDAILGR